MIIIVGGFVWEQHSDRAVAGYLNRVHNSRPLWPIMAMDLPTHLRKSFAQKPMYQDKGLATTVIPFIKRIMP